MRKRVVALPAEGVLNPATSEASLSGEAGAPAKRVVALPVEGVLSPNLVAVLRGEARRALPVEGVLNPNIASW